jgi:hypothetical protein
MITKDEIGALGIARTKEWILYHKYNVFKCGNDMIFHRERLKRLKLHLQALKSKQQFTTKKRMITDSSFDKPNEVIPNDEDIPEDGRGGRITSPLPAQFSKKYRPSDI